MERTQKKCLIISATTHGALLAVLVVGSAFVKPPAPREIVPIKYFSGRLVDSIVNGGGGGAPVVVRAPTPAPPNPTPPAPTPPTPTPPVPTPPRQKNNVPVVTEPNPPKTAKSKATADTTSTSKRNDSRFTLTSKKAADKTAKTAKTTGQTSGKANNERLAAFNRTFSELGQSLTSGGLAMSTTPGNGLGGGPGAVNYSQAVLGAYDDAWNPPAELQEDVAVAVVRITVHRTGRIEDARIIQRSGNALMDRSVQNALEAVKSLPPFPEGAKDIERVFKIEFNLKVKRGLG